MKREYDIAYAALCKKIKAQRIEIEFMPTDFVAYSEDGSPMFFWYRAQKLLPLRNPKVKLSSCIKCALLGMLSKRARKKVIVDGLLEACRNEDLDVGNCTLKRGLTFEELAVEGDLDAS